MLVSQLLLYIYAAHAASPDDGFYRRTTRAMTVDSDPFSPDARFNEALVLLRKDLIAERERNAEIELLLPSLNLEKSRLERDLGSLQNDMAETRLQLEAKLEKAGEAFIESEEQRKEMARDLEELRIKQIAEASAVVDLKKKLAEVDDRLQKTQTENEGIKESLDRHKMTEEELRENLGKLQSVLKDSNMRIRTLTGQRALEGATVETYVKEVGGFVVMVEAIISTNKELGKNCQLLEEALVGFKTDSSFSTLAKDVKLKFDEQDVPTMALFHQKKSEIRLELDSLMFKMQQV